MKDDRAANQAALARYASLGLSLIGIGPYVGPSWPDPSVDFPAKGVRFYEGAGVDAFKILGNMGIRDWLRRPFTITFLGALSKNAHYVE